MGIAKGQSCGSQGQEVNGTGDGPTVVLLRSLPTVMNVNGGVSHGVSKGT